MRSCVVWATAARHRRALPPVPHALGTDDLTVTTRRCSSRAQPRPSSTLLVERRDADHAGDGDCGGDGYGLCASRRRIALGTARSLADPPETIEVRDVAIGL